MTFAAALFVVAAAAAAARQPALPRAVLQSNQLLLSLPASVLRNAAMEKQLTNGLTTVIATSVEAGAIRGAVRVDIRYELWDEQFLVGVADASGRKQLTFATFDKLVTWWSAAAFRVATVSANDAPPRISVKMVIVPFSAAEEADAQRWLMRSLTEATNPRARDPQKAGATTSILDVIIGTGVRRKPVESWRWTVPLTRQ